MLRIYNKIDNLKDLRTVSNKIRKDIRKVKLQSALTELHKRQSFLVTLTYSPSFRKKFGSKIISLRKVAKFEYTKTALLINRKAKSLGLKVKYDKYWGRKG